MKKSLSSDAVMKIRKQQRLVNLKSDSVSNFIECSNYAEEKIEPRDQRSMYSELMKWPKIDEDPENVV